jgi:hypothetical protein
VARSHWLIEKAALQHEIVKNADGVGVVNLSLSQLEMEVQWWGELAYRTL